MSNAWEHAQNLADKHANQGGIFIRLANDGDKVVGAFCGYPYAREVVWTGERYETHDPDAHPDKRPSLRVALNFYVPDEAEMKVIEGGTLWFRDVLKVKEKYGLEYWLFEVQRHGESGDPKTKYSILPEDRISGDLLEVIVNEELFDLESLIEGGNASGRPEEDRAPSVGKSLDPRVASEIVGRLKALPRSEVDLFLRQFQVTRVRDLAPEDVEKARTLLAELEAKQSTEIDPFA